MMDDENCFAIEAIFSNLLDPIIRIDNLTEKEAKEEFALLISKSPLYIEAVKDGRINIQRFHKGNHLEAALS